MAELGNKRILLGLTGGIAAYKSAELVRLLVKEGADVQVVMTEAACQFITPVTMQALSGKQVFTGMWDTRVPNGMPHIELSRDRDLIVVAPATADFLAKLLHGAADDLLATLCLARECPLLVAPAMNRQMWENPATQRNAAQLRQDGILVVGPAAGDQACGETGMGRMVEPEQILETVVAWFQPKLLAGARVLVTAGPTFEPIDAVRGITNLSSGRMGYAVARAAIEAGAEVTLVTGRTELTPPAGAKLVQVVTAQEMFDAVIAGAADADIFIGVAAVADYHVANRQEHKIKKDSAAALTLELAPESRDLERYAQEKRQRKNVPLMAANLVQNALGAEDNELVLFDDGGIHRLARSAKLEQARALVRHIARLYKPARAAVPAR
jgi:phosphopantothenoylcysteine decarboxylase/phosphopantothenate--cysteine ligase